MDRIIEVSAYNAAIVSGLIIAGITLAPSNENMHAQKTYNSGIGSALIVGATMGLIEYSAHKYLNTNIFSTSIPHQAIKIGIAITTAAGFSFFRSIYTDIAKNKKLGPVYLRGLLCGGLFLLPFCSNL